MSGRRWIVPLRVCVVMVAVLMGPIVSARAQDVGFLTPGSRERASVRVDWGYAGVMRAERTSPVVVWVDSGEPLSGVVRVTYAQDASQSVVMERPFAVTPGRPVPVVLPVTLPSVPDNVELRVVDQGGRTLVERVFGVGPRADEPLPEIAYAEQMLVGVVGDDRLPEWFRLREERLEASLARWINEATLIEQGIAGRSWEVNERREVSEDDPLDIRVTRLDPSAIESWMDLGGLDAIVVRPDAGVPGRVRDAITTWTRSGGTMYLLVDRAGAPVRTWLGQGPDPIVIMGPREMDVPEAVRAHLVEAKRRAAERESEAKGDGADGVAAARSAGGALKGVPTPEDIAGLEPGDRVSARGIRLTTPGERVGWRALEGWTVEGEALAAHGRLGLGRVFVLGVDPGACVRTLSAFGGAAAWEGALEPVASTHRALIADGRDRSSWWKPPSGETSRQRAGIEGVVEASVESVPNALGVLVFVAIVLAIMTLGMGPVDMFVLRALRLRHRSWLTALGWIALASLGAWLIPIMASASGESSSLARVAFVQAESPFDAGEGRVDGGMPAWRTEIVTAFARGPGSFDLGDGDRAWRGVSSKSEFRSQRSGRLDPMRITIVGAGEGRGMLVRPVSLGMWGVRSAMSKGPMDASELASIERARVVSGDEYEVTVRVASGWTVEGARLDGAPALVEPGVPCVVRFAPASGEGSSMPSWADDIGIAAGPGRGETPGRVVLDLALTRRSADPGAEVTERMLVRTEVIGLSAAWTPDERAGTGEAEGDREDPSP